MKKRTFLCILIAVICLLPVAFATSPQAQFITCRNCGRDPGKCMPNWDSTDLPDPGCITVPGTPCSPYKGVQYTVRWNGASILELPNVVNIEALGEMGMYAICYPGSVVYSQYKPCEPKILPPLCTPGSFIALANHGIARSVLPQFCGASGIAPFDDVRYGMIVPYYAAVNCSDGPPVSWKQLTHACR